MNEGGYIIALMMGLTGSLHCAGMCGPIIWAVSFHSLQGGRKWAGLFLYHFGRISAYAFLGYMLYTFTSFFKPAWQQYISLFAGITLLIAGVLSFLPLIHIHLPGTSWVLNMLGKYLGNPGIQTLGIAGTLHGLLPCGLVYMALSMAVQANSPTQALGLMYMFGLGTLPMLLALTFFRHKISFLRKDSFRKMVPVFLLFFGVLFILRGMNLGIPYISPSITTSEQGVVNTTCCHKN